MRYTIRYTGDSPNPNPPPSGQVQARVDDLLTHAGEVLDAVALLPLDRALLLAAGAFAEPALRALDAIHTAADFDVSPVDAFVSYDERQSAAARLAGLRTIAPGA